MTGHTDGSSDRLSVWRIDTLSQTIVFASFEGRIPEIVYWGAALPSSEDLTMIARHAIPDVTGGMIDRAPSLSLCPVSRNGFEGHPGLIIRGGEGSWIHPDFILDEAISSSDGKTLSFICSDQQTGIIYRAEFTKQTEHVISACASVRLGDAGRNGAELIWLSAPVLPVSSLVQDVQDYGGRWCGELQPLRTPLQMGQRRRDNPTGRSGHQQFPAILLLSQGATNNSGDVWALTCDESSGHSHIIEHCADGRRQIQMGTYPFAQTELSDEYSSPAVYLGYSSDGMNGCGTAFQHFVRDRLVPWPSRKHGKDRLFRPVHYNCWEAVYFDHDLDTLKDIASRAAELGAERFILDDGWFGERHDDTSSLGDWYVNSDKYPDGLGPLIEHVKSCGMEFGLWFEPEMVNRDSDFYRAHPEAALGEADQTEGRQQRVLDLTQPLVSEMITERLTSLLSEYDIDYIKWDHNRVLPLPDARQADRLHQILSYLRDRFPELEIESCASGGGRMDYGMLAHTHRVWLSDSNDAVERARIQHEAALWLPSVVSGSHVGPEQCHTSGRILTMSMRAWVAAQRHMGFEMDVRSLSDEDAETLASVTSWWKTNRNWMLTGSIFRLDSADAAVTAELQLAQDKSRFVVFASHIAASSQITPQPLRLSGLDPDERYQIELVNKADLHHLSRGHPLLKSDMLCASGQYLMQHGITLPWSFPQQIWVVSGERI